MGLGRQKLEEESPLDALANRESRVSVLSTASTGSGILDAFPLPLGIETQLSHASSNASLNRYVADFLNKERNGNSQNPQAGKTPKDTNKKIDENEDDSTSSTTNHRHVGRPQQSNPDPKLAINPNLKGGALSVSAPGSATEPASPTGRYPWDVCKPQLVSGTAHHADGHMHTQNLQLERTQKRYLRYGKSFENSPDSQAAANAHLEYSHPGFAFPGNMHPGHKFHRGHSHAASYSAYPGAPAPAPPMMPNAQQLGRLDQQGKISQNNGARGKDMQGDDQHVLQQQGVHQPIVDQQGMLSRPQITRSHSLSRSWDAGGANGGYSFPTPAPVPSIGPLKLEPVQRLNSWQEHIEKGCEFLRANNKPNAYLNWSIAASPPWSSPIGNLLVQLGMMERWFSLNPGQTNQYIPNMENLKLKTINLADLKSLTCSISIQVREALNNLGALLKRIQDNPNAAVAYEMAGALGSRDGLLSAAHIYYKGDKRIRDVARAQKLYHRADAL